MLKIKLQPTGKRNQRLYRIIVAEERSKLTGDSIANIGTYNPHHPENIINLDKTQYDYWLSKGAQPTATIKKLVNKLP